MRYGMKDDEQAGGENIGGNEINPGNLYYPDRVSKADTCSSGVVITLKNLSHKKEHYTGYTLTYRIGFELPRQK